MRSLTMSPDGAARQLTLKVQLRDDATFDNFLAPEALAPLVASLQGQLQPGGEALIYLFGGADGGKSHLLQAACHSGGARAVYLPLAELVGFSPQEVLEGMEGMSLVCLDDIEAVLGNEAWELALFHFFNRARALDCRLLIGAKSPPRVLGVGLADLKSRLSWGIVYQLPPVTDEYKQRILQFRAGARGLALPADVATYIVSRAPRELGTLLALLDRLDEASLAEKRALSIPFVKKTLGW